MGTVLREQVFDDLVGILAPNLMCPSHSVSLLSNELYVRCVGFNLLFPDSNTFLQDSVILSSDLRTR